MRASIWSPCGLVFLGVLLVGAAQTFLLPWRRIDLLRADSTGSDTTARRIDELMDTEMPLRFQFIAFANALSITLMRSTPPDVRIGRDGWFFLPEEFEYDADADANEARRIETAVATRDYLRARGVDLVVVVVPDKVRIHGEHLIERSLLPYRGGRYAHFVKSLEERGVRTVDLAEAFAGSGEYYYRTDTHWNHRGARRAASEIAAVVPSHTGPAGAIRLIEEGEISRRGDLLALLKLDGIPWMQEREPSVRCESSRPDDEESLFGTASAKVVLAGSSYSLRSAFDCHLQHALGQDLLNLSADRAGFPRTMLRYLTDESFHQAPPEVIIWEFPEREVSVDHGSHDRKLHALVTSASRMGTPESQSR